MIKWQSVSACLLFAPLLMGEAPFAGSPTANKQETKPSEASPEVKGADAKATDPKGPPFADKPAQAAAAKPAERTWTVKSGDFAFSLAMKPGIPDPDQVTEILISANSVPKTPHPRFGNRVPLENAKLTVEVTSPGGEVVARFLAHAMPLSSGKYGIHFTPAQVGIYTLGVRGSTADGKTVSADVKLPVKTWPLPPELQGSGDGAEKSSGRQPIKM